MLRPGPDDTARLGRASLFTCPECHGPPWEIADAVAPEEAFARDARNSG